MELDVLKLHTTWNDAANSINTNFSKIQMAIASLGTGGGGLNEDELRAFLVVYLAQNGYATKDDIDNAISDIINGAPSTLDTLKEIADALAESDEIIVALNNAIGTKASKDELNEGLNTLANSKITISGVDVSLGGEITQQELRTGLGLETLVDWYNRVGVAFGKKGDGTYFVDGDFLANGQFAAAAVGAEGGGSVGAAYLSDLYDVSLGSLLSGDILSWNGSEWVNIKQSSLVPDLSAYASKSFVSDALEGYLPKSGGTISGSLQIGNDDNTAYNYLRLVREGYEMYVNCNAYGGYISYGAIGAANAQLRLVSDSITFNGNTLIHSGNIGDYAITSSGEQSISGKKTIFEQYTDKWSIGGDVYNLTISRSGGWAANLAYIANTYGGSTSKATISAYGDSGTINYMYLGLSENYNGNNLRIYSDNVAFGDHTIIHSGNIGSQSVYYASNAGTLGGIPLNNGSNTPWGTIPMITTGGYMDVGKHFEFHYDNTTGSDYSTVLSCAGNYGNFVWLPSASGTLALTTDNVASANILSTSYSENINYSSYTNDLRLIRNTDDSWSSNGFPTNYVSGLSVMAGYVGWQMVTYGDPNFIPNPYFRSIDGGGDWSSWRKLAFLDDNVASATKLATPRTIWGQSFDGTGNVDGKIYQDGKWIIGTHADSNLYIGFDTRATSTLIFGNIVQFYDSIGNYTMRINESGNVLIGTTTDSGHKLQVNGTVNLFGHAIDDVSELRCYDSGTGYFVGKRNNGLGATDGGLLLFSYGATPMSFYTNSAERMHINASGNVTIGSSDLAGTTRKLYVNGALTATKGKFGNIHINEGSGTYVGDSTIETSNKGMLYINYYHNGGLNLCQGGGNVLVGTTTDNGYKLDVNGILRATAANFGGDWGINIGMTYADNTSGAYDLIERKKSGYPLYFQYHHNGNLFMCQGGGNVIIGTTEDRGHKLDVNGAAMAHRWLTSGENGVWKGSHYTGSLGNNGLAIVGDNVWIFGDASARNNLSVAGGFVAYGASTIDSTLSVIGKTTLYDTLTAQNGIVTNEITIGGIKLDVYNGALRVNGDIFSTGQFAASVAGEATGGSNIVLDYASIVNALGYTPANNNNLAQVAFTGSYTDLSNKPTSLPASDVYSWAKASVKPTYSWSEIQSKPDVYTKQEVDDKLSDIGGGEGCNCDDSTSGLGDTIYLYEINWSSYDVPNGVNCVVVDEDAELDFSSAIPLDPSRPCIMYLVKTGSYTLEVNSSSNITSVDSYGGLSSRFSVDGYTGMMLVWNTEDRKWHAYIQKM